MTTQVQSAVIRSLHSKARAPDLCQERPNGDGDLLLKLAGRGSPNLSEPGSHRIGDRRDSWQREILGSWAADAQNAIKI